MLTGSVIVLLIVLFIFIGGFYLWRKRLRHPAFGRRRKPIENVIADIVFMSRYQF
jgi:hypothetical protein